MKIYNNIKTSKIYGWSRKDFSNSYYNTVENLNEIEEFFQWVKKTGKNVSLRSAGNSYGDNTLNNENIILHHKNYNKILNFDENNGLIEVESGITMLEIIEFTAPKKWMLEVCPAKKDISVSGCLSNNVHGKNCFKKGYFGEYVLEFYLYSYEKGILKCSRKENSDIFFCVISGLGILGIILSVKIKLRKIKSFYLYNTTTKFNNIANIVENLEIAKNFSEFNIASCDTTKFSNLSMPGIIYSSDYTNDNNFNLKKITDKKIINFINNLYLMSKYLPFIDILANLFFSLNASGKFINNKKNIISFFQMNFLLDIYLPKYNFFFKKGFIEYQAVFDTKNTNIALNELRKVLHKNNTYGLISAVKAYRKSSEKFIFALNKNGYCTSFDIPYENENKMNKIIRELNNVTIKYDGQLYMAKTPCLNSDEFNEMYKNKNDFLKIKKKLDPKNIIQSDLTKRLELFV